MWAVTRWLPRPGRREGSAAHLAHIAASKLHACVWADHGQVRRRPLAAPQKGSSGSWVHLGPSLDSVCRCHEEKQKEVLCASRDHTVWPLQRQLSLRSY